VPRSPESQNQLHNLWRTRSYLQPYLSTYLWVLFAGIVTTALGVAIPLIVARVVDGPVRRGDEGGLLVLGLLALALGLVEAFLIFIRRWVQSNSALSMETAMRDDLYRHLQSLPVSFHDGWQSGQLLSRATTDLSVIRRFLSFGLIFLVLNTATAITVVALLMHLYWPLGVLVSASAVPLFWFSQQFTRSYNKAARLMQDQQGDLATVAEETAAGIRLVKAFGRRDYMAAKFSRYAGQIHDTAVGKATMVARTWSKFDAVPNVTLAVVLVGGALAVARDAMTVGELVAFVSLQLMLIWPIDALGFIIANAQEAMTAADRFYEVIDTEPDIVDRPGAAALDPATIRGEVRFEGVRFAYPDAPATVLHSVDLEVRPGETVAIAGVTGSGKTTLVSLIPRLIDADSGRVLIDGHDIRDVTLESLRSVVAVAFEEPILFSMSVRENLTLGRPDATDADIEEALDVAQADFVRTLPWGLDTRVGEQGLSLSGGQRQRLALARAVLSRPKVLVLDDPLSALDVHTEALVERALTRVLAGTTAIIVVHRPSTVALADRVAFLKDGVIAGVGTHADLLAKNPDYAAVLSAAAEEDDAAEVAA
jgi:ATP-binding cassette subfamily B protein